MAETGVKAAEQLREITECPICLSTFTDPRMLPCIHTLCFQCLNVIRESAQMNPGDKMPCPLCRKEFVIPIDGVNGVQKNFFMQNLLEFKTAVEIGSATVCDMCNVRNEGNTEKPGQTPKATMRCMECRDYYCDSCVKVHKFQKLSRHHQIVRIGSDMKSEAKRLVSMKSCTKHIHKPLDYYCFECKKIVCVSCFVESHKFHDCKDVTTVDEEFRKRIEGKALKVSAYVDEMLLMKNNNQKRIAEFLKQISEREEEIHKRNKELKDMIDRHTNSLLDELYVIKSKHLKEMDTEMEEIERCCTIFGSFEAYCTELTLKGSASDICSSVDELSARADDLETDLEAFTGRPHTSIEVSFQATELGDCLQNFYSNFMGYIKETTKQYENFAIVVGLNDGTTTTEDVVKINLHRPNEISTQDDIPATMTVEVVATVFDNTMYVAGIGNDDDEIWKYSLTSGWLKCASLVQGRRRHSAAFIDDVLYICGGFVYSTKVVLDSVEAFSVISNACTAVGTLVRSVQASGNCVEFRKSLYIFGGMDKDSRAVSHVQVYNTMNNICTLLSRMPRRYGLMQAVLWETSVILIGNYTCFIFDIESKTWQGREQFKTDVSHFGLVLDSGRLFVIGGGNWEKDKDGKNVWKCRDDIRCVPLQNILLNNKRTEWKIHGKLPKPSLVHTCANLRF